MRKELEYSFDDEPVRKFCFDIYNNKLEIHFEGFYDVIENAYKEGPCAFSIENWEYAKSKIGDGSKLYDLHTQIGVFSLILYMKYNENEELEMLVNTVDNRYLTFFFKNAQLKIIATS